jgi:hypothetical protein
MKHHHDMSTTEFNVDLCYNIIFSFGACYTRTQSANSTLREHKMREADWLTEIANGRLPQGSADFKEMAQIMEHLGMKGTYNPVNVYSGSPFESSRNLKYEDE